ncbi:MAG: hypothetical protein OHK0053_08270 [Microscillaceae bacterium]
MDSAYQDFFKKALAIQAQKREKLTEAEKKEIALELGFSETDWQAVLDSFAAHFERGKAFLVRDNFQEAIPELQEALLIQPENTEALSKLALAHLGLYRHKKGKLHKEKALQFARECLQYDPDNLLAHQVMDAFNPTKPAAKIPLKITQAASYSSPQKKKMDAVKSSWSDQLIFKIISALPVLAVLSVMGMLLAMGIAWMKKNKSSVPSQETATNIQQTSKLQEYKAQVPVVFVSNSARFAVKQQTDSTWLVTSPEGKEIFQLSILKNDWLMRAENEESREARFALNYAFYVKVEMLTDNINRDKVKFRPVFLNKKKKYLGYKVPNVLWLEPFMPAYYCYRKGDVAYLKFHSLDKEYFIQSNLTVPEYWQSPALLEIHLEQIDFGVTPEEEYHLNSRINPASNKPKIKGIYYQGKKYDKLDIKVREAYWGIEHSYQDHLNYYWVAQIINKDPKRTLKSLRFETQYFDITGRRIETHSSYRESAAITPHVFPMLKSQDKILMELRNHLKMNTSDELAPYKEIHIQEMQWE